MTTTHITFTGIYGEMRRRGKEYVERLKAVYDGCLVLGVTTHVVCDPTRIAGSAPSEKLLLAVEAGIPVLSFRWLEQCAQAGRWLPLEGYTIALRAMHPATGFASEPEAVLEERCEIIEDREPTANGKSSKSGSDIVIEDDDVTAFRDAAGCFVGCSIEIHQNVNLNRNQDADRSNRATCEQDEHVVESRRRSNAAAEQNSASVPPTSPSLSPTHLRLTYSCPRAESSRVEALPNMIKVSTDAPRSPPPAAAIFQPMVSVKAGPFIKASERWLSRKIQSIEAHHGVPLQPEQVKFYEIATVSNTANEAQKKVILKSSPDQGVSLLYDVDKVSGKKTFARALITCIYSLEIATDHSELWMGVFWFAHILLDTSFLSSFFKC